MTTAKPDSQHFQEIAPMRNFCAALLILTAAFAGPAAAQDMSWVGKVGFVKKPGIKIGKSDAQGNQIYFATLADFGYRVLGEQDGWIKVSDGRGSIGWFDKADAVLSE